MPARGRPLGEVSKTVLLELGRQPRSVHQLAVDLQAHERMMVIACSKLKAAGRLQVVGVARASRSGRRWPCWRCRSSRQRMHRSGRGGCADPSRTLTHKQEARHTGGLCRRALPLMLVPRRQFGCVQLRLPADSLTTEVLRTGVVGAETAFNNSWRCLARTRAKVFLRSVLKLEV